MRFLVRIVFACAALLAIPLIVHAQDGRACSVSARNYAKTQYNLVNHAGDIISFAFRDTRVPDSTDGYYRVNGKQIYGFASTRVSMDRSGSLLSLGVGCNVNRNMRFEISFARSASTGSVSGTINSVIDTLLWWRSTWQSQPLPLFNYETCSNADGTDNGKPCASPIPYWSSDEYSANNFDALAAYTLLARKDFTVEALAGFTLNRMRYTFITGERQSSRVLLSGEITEDGITPVTAEYKFQNEVFLQSTSTSRATFFGPAFGVRVNKSMGRLRLRATLRHDILREQGADSVAFIDTDELYECLRNVKSGRVYWCHALLLDGGVSGGGTRNGFSSRTVGDASVNWRATKRIELNLGFSVSHQSAHLTQQLVKQWGLSTNRAPDALEFSNLPRKGGVASGFGASGLYVGATLSPF